MYKSEAREKYGQEHFGHVSASKLSQVLKRGREKRVGEGVFGKRQYFQHRLRKMECGERLKSDQRAGPSENNIH